MSSAAPSLPKIPLPPELPAEHVDAYLEQVRDIVAQGGDAERIARGYSAHVADLRAQGIDPFDPALNEVAFSGTAEECIRHLEPDDADDIIEELRAEGLLCGSSA